MTRTFSAGLIAAAIGILAGVPSVVAQTAVTPEQMRLFQNLSESEKAQIIGQFGGGQAQFQQATKPAPGEGEDQMGGPQMARAARASGRILGAEIHRGCCWPSHQRRSRGGAR